MSDTTELEPLDPAQPGTVSIEIPGLTTPVRTARGKVVGHSLAAEDVTVAIAVTPARKLHQLGIVNVEVNARIPSGRRRGPAVPARLHVAGVGYVPALTHQRLSSSERRLAFLTLSVGVVVASWATGMLNAMGWGL